MSDDIEVLKAMVQDLARDAPDRLTLLDRFACAALQGLLASEHIDPVRDYASKVRRAYDYAEQMLRRRAVALGLRKPAED